MTKPKIKSKPNADHLDRVLTMLKQFGPSGVLPTRNLMADRIGISIDRIDDVMAALEEREEILTEGNRGRKVVTIASTGQSMSIPVRSSKPENSATSRAEQHQAWLNQCTATGVVYEDMPGIPSGNPTFWPKRSDVAMGGVGFYG